VIEHLRRGYRCEDARIEQRRKIDPAMDDSEFEEVTGEVVSEGKTPHEASLDAAQALLDKLRGDAHPSTTQMDIIEGMLPRELFPQYLAILTEKVEAEPYPSTALLQRIQRLSTS
jgi:hypothetical protein